MNTFFSLKGCFSAFHVFLHSIEQSSKTSSSFFLSFFFFFAWVFCVRMCAAGILLDEAFCALCTYLWGPVNNTTCRNERVGQDKCAFVYTPYLRRRSLEQGSTINFLREGLLLGSVCIQRYSAIFSPSCLCCGEVGMGRASVSIPPCSGAMSGVFRKVCIFLR